jgi:hypothetical protein
MHQRAAAALIKMRAGWRSAQGRGAKNLAKLCLHETLFVLHNPRDDLLSCNCAVNKNRDIFIEANAFAAGAVAGYFKGKRSVRLLKSAYKILPALWFYAQTNGY